MPSTKFKLIFETEEPDIDIERFKQSLPSSFHVIEEDNGIFINIDSIVNDDENAKYLIDRELDRHFFITCVKITAEIVRSRAQTSFTSWYRIHGELPEDVKPQVWNYELPIMLRLWSMAIDLHNEFRLQILYYFHIIELAYPDSLYYPNYTDSTKAPNRLTECKFIRHLVAHAGEVGGTQLKKYCEYLGIPELMFDVTDLGYQSILLRKVKLLEEQAKLAINKCL
jgi:hypothetical protein